MSLKEVIIVWLRQIRAPFLVLPVVLVLIGVAAAHHEGIFHPLHFALLLIGAVLSNVSVNLFNELSDYRTKIDERTIRTPFSGGSGMLQVGRTSPKSVNVVAYGTLMVAASIGLYFCFVSGWLILLFMVSGGLAIRYYTSHFARWFIGEFVAGLTIGTLMVLGVYYALTGRLTVEVVWVSIAPGILTSLLLFLNEFPDAEADEAGGRRHLVIQLGKRRSAIMYVAGLAMVYGTIILGPFIIDIPLLTFIALFTLPLSVRACVTVLKAYDDIPRLVPALGMNVGIVILTDALLATGYFLSS